MPSELQPFDETTTGMGYYDNLLENPEYFARAKGIRGEIVYMSPGTYIALAAAVKRITLDQQYQTVESELLQKYTQAMLKREKFPMPVLEPAKESQEGFHRALAAKKLGIKRIPVLLVTGVEPTKKHLT